jgi:hypothetical protein
VPGGYLSSFNPQNTLYIYDPVANSWSNGASMPTAVGDYGIGAYGDSLIYVVCGYSGSGDVSNVQIYNTRTNTWSAGTSFAGFANAGGRMGISGNKIVYAGGYRQSASQPLNDAWLGEIDPADPAIITWTAIPGGLPTGTSTRFGGGAGFNDGRVYFTSGDPTGQGNTVGNQTIAYNTLNAVWEMGPLKPTGVSNVSNFAFAIANDSMYLVSVGGYNGSAITAGNERLNIGPFIPASAWGDTAVCDAGTIQLYASGGISYDWSPSALVSDTASANPTAAITQSETFTVSIETRFGCPTMATVGATVYPSAAVSQSFDLCYGGSVTVGNTTYTESGAYNDTLQTINGCDSIVTTILNIQPLNAYTQTITLCSDETYSIDGNTYAVSGIYTDTLTAMNGCDSVVTTQLDIQPLNASTQNINLCSGETYTIGGNTYSVSGTYTDTLTTITGCDSIVTLVLDVTDIDGTVSLSGITITANQPGAEYQWIDCSGGTPVAGETGQSFTPAANGIYAAVIGFGNCSDTSECTAITTIGLHELTQSAPEIWPNPNNGSFTIRSGVAGTFTLTDEAGRTLATFPLDAANDHSFTFSGLQSGVYFIAGNDQQRQKVVVTH